MFKKWAADLVNSKFFYAEGVNIYTWKSPNNAMAVMPHKDVEKPSNALLSPYILFWPLMSNILYNDTR